MDGSFLKRKKLRARFKKKKKQQIESYEEKIANLYQQDVVPAKFLDLEKKFNNNDLTILSVIKTKVFEAWSCSVCGGKGHSAAICPSKQEIDKAVRNIPGVREAWWKEKYDKVKE